MRPTLLRLRGSSVEPRVGRHTLICSACALTLLAGVSCTDGTSPEPASMLAPPSAKPGFTYEDSVRVGFFQQDVSSPMTAAACEAGGCPQLVSAHPPSLFQGFDQPGLITLTFAGPVGSVTVTGHGAIECSTGQHGVLVGYDAAGSELGRINLQLIDPGDCGQDNVTFGAEATLVTTAVMATAEILPMHPIEFPVFDLVGHASATYSVSVGPLTAPPPGPPGLTVTCPPSVTRGELITCDISMSPDDTPYTITQLTATTFADEALVTLELTPPGTQAAGQVYRLEGPAVSPTTLTVEATVVTEGETQTLTKSAIFAVSPRPAELEDYLMTLRPEVSGPGETVSWPSITTAGGALGLYDRQAPDWNHITISTADAGPNSGLSYVTSVPRIPASLIYLTLAIFPGEPWYAAHPITPGKLNHLGLRICTRSVIDDLRLQIERHEGVTMADNSHFGIDQGLLRTWGFSRLFGGMVTAAQGSPVSIQKQLGLAMAIEWKKEAEVLATLQAGFDATDTPAIFNSLECSIFLD